MSMFDIFRTSVGKIWKQADTNKDHRIDYNEALNNAILKELGLSYGQSFANKSELKSFFKEKGVDAKQLLKDAKNRTAQLKGERPAFEITQSVSTTTAEPSSNTPASVSGSTVGSSAEEASQSATAAAATEASEETTTASSTTSSKDELPPGQELLWDYSDKIQYGGKQADAVKAIVAAWKNFTGSDDEFKDCIGKINEEYGVSFEVASSHSLPAEFIYETFSMMNLPDNSAQTKNGVLPTCIESLMKEEEFKSCNGNPPKPNELTLEQKKRVLKFYIERVVRVGSEMAAKVDWDNGCLKQLNLIPTQN